MNPTQRTQLTKALSTHVAAIAADLRAQMLAAGPVRERAKTLHAEEQVGDDFDVWTDLLSRRAAVLWVLKTVYVRVLEDRGLVRPGRLLDPEAQHLFEKLAPNLGETAFLTWVFRDLASPHGGLPELFAPQPAEIAVPADALSRALIGFWRSKDADTGFQWSFADEAFAGELMGDLYQELDPVVKDRYALCQTPDFVRDFMLGQTLTPAIAELGADVVRVLDPACGSGHFLLDALRRLVDATAAQHADWSRRQVVEHALDRVVGIDLNDYACALARARLVMTAAELSGATSLAEAATFHPHVYWADGLEQVERDEEPTHVQLDLLGPNAEPPPRAVLTRPHVRAALRPLLAPKFQVVVGNPPYITERDPARKAYHREKVGKAPRYISAYRTYSLAAPFVERCLQLGAPDGWIGLIVGNNFMKREFGKPLVEEVLANVDLNLVVDTSQAFIPHHGTPTVMLFARNRTPDNNEVRAVMGKRGEPSTPEIPAQGRVWCSIVDGFATPNYESEFVSVAEVARETLGKHPWSLGGGGAAGLRATIEAGAQQLDAVVQQPIGRAARTGEDEILVHSMSAARRTGIEEHWFRTLLTGDGLRDWCESNLDLIIYPYDSTADFAVRDLTTRIAGWLWKYRTRLADRATFQGKMSDAGKRWYEYMQYTSSANSTPMSIAFAFVATHNHFALDRGGKVFNRSAPVIKLPPGATEDDHLALLGLLNSSTACFWMKQVFHCKGSQGVNEGSKAELWEQFYEFDATKLKLFPIAENREVVVPYARTLDGLARRRAERSVAAILGGDGWTTARELRALLDERRTADLADLRQMVAAQEELDWVCYRLYGLDRNPTYGPDELEPIDPTLRPVELELAVRDEANRAAIARGEETTEIPTAWFTRHGWEPRTELPADVSPRLREVIEHRRSRIAAVPEIALIEQTTYKRRWYRPDHAAEEQQVMSAWLADRIEHELSSRGGKPASIAQLTAAVESDPRVQAVAELLTGRKDYRLADLVAGLVTADAVPEHPLHVYKPTGLDKRAAWERTWDEQRKEDAGLPARPEVPPKYGQGDFLKPEYYRLRGKLDVPKERFIAFTEVPGRGAGELLYGWAGWTPAERVKAILAIDEECEDQGITLADRVALLDSAWRLLPDVLRDDPATGARLKAELAALLGPDGPSKDLLADWKTRFPPPGGRGRGRARRAAARPVDDEVDEAHED
ncbi:MAG: BREX-2 system adenine-specific DNA-methyltransferase PglX [Myxococcales bacterium]|nr:BREX-2 system adenine-specific DNA-methyltransferase PglX [Myxococcales bacterium]